MPPGGLVVPTAVDEQVEVQLSFHGAHSVVLGSRVTAIGQPFEAVPPFTVTGGEMNTNW
jgi:hypothetical protein